MSDEKSSKKGGVQSVLRDLVIGGSMGALSKTVMSPVERVKLLMQMTNSHPDVVSGKVKGFDSMGECAQRIYKTQGVLAFWRGNLVNCLRYAPQQGSALAFNDAINDLFPKYDSKKQFWPSLGSKLMSGGLAGAIANTICYPFDFARTRLASDVGTTKQFNGIMDCIATTVRQQGIRGLYTGWSVTVAGAFVYRAGQLGCFRQIQDMNPYKNDKGTLGAVSSFAAVTAARTVVLPFNYPFDTVRRRMMQWADKPLSERIYKSSVHCFTTVLKTEGLRGIYAGALPEIFRGIGGSLVIVAYDRIKVIYNL